MTELATLNRATLSRIAGRQVDGITVEIPNYSQILSKRICHIGIGRFHRAHQAHYLHRLLQQGLGDGWGICAIGLRATDRPVLDALQAQNGLYSLWEMDGSTRRGTVIGSIMEVVDASADSRRAIEMISDAATRIVSLTITEQGYCLAANGSLDLSHPDIAHDLMHPDAPRSAPGLVVRALAARRSAGRSAGRSGLTLMSCDNMIENGRQLRTAVVAFAQEVDAELAAWITRAVSFPSSMVDRITPAANLDLQSRICAEWRLEDQALVTCEDWRQWVLEDAFVSGRPAFEKSGVVMSSHVKSYEDMKVGLLNGAHSALSHIGLMKGHVRVHEALADSLIRQWLENYMREITEILEPVPGLDFAEYQMSLMKRFLNPAIEDRLTRLAQDTSAKFQQTLLPPVIKRLELGLPVPCIATAITLWVLFLDHLQGDVSARDAYHDASKDSLITLAGRAVAARDATDFLARTLPLAPEYSALFCAAVNQQFRGLLASGVAAHVGRLA